MSFGLGKRWGSGCCFGDHFEDCSFDLLEVGDNLEEVPGLRVSRGPEHAHENLWGASKVGAELHKADRAVDVFAEDGLSCVQVAGEHGADGFAEERAAEAFALLEFALDGFVEALGKWH